LPRRCSSPPRVRRRPAFARILKAVEDVQLEGEITTPEEALDLVRRLFEPPEGRTR